MKKSIRNFVLGVIAAAGVMAASTAAFAGSMQYVQNDMNFRSGAGTTTAVIGSVPAGAQVEVLDTVNGWNLIRYNGVTGYIHGGNVADTFTAPKQVPVQQAAPASSTQAYFDNNWIGTAQSMNTSAGSTKTVSVQSSYLALRTAPAYDAANEIGQLYSGDKVELIGGAQGSYVKVYSPKFGTTGWVNAGFLY